MKPRDRGERRRGNRLSLLVLLIILFSALLRLPQIRLNLPFLYNIDDAPAVSATLGMIRSNTFRPQPFIKPALPFLTYFPAVGLGFLKSVEHGELRKFSQIRNLNPYGDHNHEYTVSHPRVIKYMRVWCISVVLLLIYATYYLGASYKEKAGGVLSAFFLSLSPALLVFSPLLWFISDTLLTLFVVLSTLSALRFLSTDRLSLLLLSSLTAAVAVACKYNAFPILVVPLLAWSLRCSFKVSERPSLPWFPGCLLLLGVAAVGFLLAAPHTVLSFRTFLDGAGWQLWAYNIAQEQTAITEQLGRYISFFGTVGLGWGILLLAVLGAAFGLVDRNKRLATLVLLSYPALLLAYMSRQNLLLGHNVLSALPALAVLAAGGLFGITTPLVRYFSVREKGRFKQTLALSALVIVPTLPSITQLWRTYQHERFLEQRGDTRTAVSDWIVKNTQETELIAVSGELLLPHSIRRLPRVGQFRATELKTPLSFTKYWQAGYDYFVLPTWSTHSEYPRLAHFPGVAEKQRIIENPDISIIDGDSLRPLLLRYLQAKTDDSLSNTKLATLPEKQGFKLFLDDDAGFKTWGEYELNPFPWQDGERRNYRWARDRYSRLEFTTTANESGSTPRFIEFIGMTPWPKQELEIYLNDIPLAAPMHLKQSWSDYRLPLPLEAISSLDTRTEHRLEFIVKKTGKLSSASLSSDSRRLAFALHQLRFTGEEKSR